MKGLFQNAFLSLLSYVPGIKVGSCPSEHDRYAFHIFGLDTLPSHFRLDAPRLIPPPPTQKQCQERDSQEKDRRKRRLLLLPLLRSRVCANAKTTTLEVRK